MSRRDPFIGRAALLQELSALVQSSAFVSVIGPGGVGKTRLVLEWLAANERNEAKRTAFVRLDGLSDASAVLGAVAAAVGMPQTGGRPYPEAIVQWLCDTELLLVLDNCEHVIDEVTALVDALVTDTRKVSVLTTSRVPLSLVGEKQLRLRVLDEQAAIDLFVERASDRAPSLRLAGAALGAVQAICQAVDGLPLAIELAAGWTDIVPVNEIASQLSQGSDLLQRRGSRPTRHDTLDDTIRWSHALLTSSARLLLRRLAAFPSSFSLEAVAPVCAGEGLTQADVLPALRELVEHSLVQFDFSTARYRLLHMVRLFAAKLAQEAGELDTVRHTHAMHFSALAQRARAVNFVPEDTWLPELQGDVDNLHEALRTLLYEGRGVEALGTAVALTMFWWTASRHREGISWLRAALDQAGEAPVMLRAATQFSLGFLEAHDTGDWLNAAIELDRGLALLEDLDEPDADLLRGYHLCLRGECDIMAGSKDAGLRRAIEGAELIARYPEDRWGQGFAAWNVGFGHERLEEWEQAASRYESVIASQHEGSLVVRMIGYQSLAGVLERNGRSGAALPFYDEALALCERVGLERLGDVHGSQARLLADCARVRIVAREDPDRAKALAIKAEALAVRLQDGAAREIAECVLQRLATPLSHVSVFRQRDAVWIIQFDEHEAVLPDSKGLRQIRHLLQSPGIEIFASDLAAAADGEPREIGRGDPVLDAEAVAGYRKRLRLLERALALDEDALDVDRRASVLREHELVSQQLAKSSGLGGRARRLGSPQERMRVNVTRTLRAAVAQVEAACPALGQHLALSIKTGSFCRYQPPVSVDWKF
ncbi:ATP-binding protein [Tianweitania sp.]|uniref:ATP-binding protein n=1 Tax=Tianweitania sp. TaxID=2021634 RepID=UPI00289D24A9|nr:AAA family ATPase [Tianweitania sp.]